MKYSEIFYTIQGEGKLIGVPSVFFRTSYCNLRCVWCFAADTQVLMADVTERSIQEVNSGDVVLSVDQDGALCAKEVLHTMSRFVDEMVRVTTASGDILTTPTHKFKTERGWFQAGVLSAPVEKIEPLAGKTLSGQRCWRNREIPSVERITAQTRVYNLTVRETHCYFANRFFVANCDTPYTSWQPENKQIAVAEAVAAITRYNCKHVVITGGEPFVQVKPLTELCQELSQRGHHITIETNATIFAPVSAHLISMSPKLQNSNPSRDHRYFRMHERGRICPDVIRKFLDRYDCQVKFVVDRPEDLEEIHLLQTEIPIPAETIVLMPQGMTPEELRPKQEWLVEICKAHSYRYSPRVHVDIWGNQRGV